MLMRFIVSPLRRKIFLPYFQPCHCALALPSIVEKLSAGAQLLLVGLAVRPDLMSSFTHSKDRKGNSKFIKWSGLGR